MEAPLEILVDAETQLVITWEDGLISRISAASLRDACKCADCLTPEGEQRKRTAVDGPVPITITDARLVGAYGVNFTFAPDGHHTGIFAFSHLREIAGLGSNGVDTEPPSGVS